MLPEPISIADLPAHVSLLDIGGIADPDALAPFYCGPEERAEYARLGHPQRRREWLAARVCLKSLVIKQGCARRPQDCRIAKDGRGRPRVEVAHRSGRVPDVNSIPRRLEARLASFPPPARSEVSQLGSGPPVGASCPLPARLAGARVSQLGSRETLLPAGQAGRGAGMTASRYAQAGKLRSLPDKPAGEPDNIPWTTPGLFDISLSHKGQFACACLSRLPGARVGIDIEPVSPRLLDLEDVFCSAADIPPNIGHRPTELTILWCLKEAAAKVTGEGLAAGLRNIVCAEVEPGRHRVQVAGRPDMTAWHFFHQQYVVALCIELPAQAGGRKQAGQPTTTLEFVACQPEC